MTIVIAWEGGTVAMKDDGELVMQPTDRSSDVLDALASTQYRFESVELDDGSIEEVIVELDPTTDEHVRAALLSLPGAFVVEEAVAQ